MATYPKTTKERKQLFQRMARSTALTRSVADVTRPNNGVPHDSDKFLARWDDNVEEYVKDGINAIRELK